MSRLLLVRHAHAGDRSRSDDDLLRPLSDRGRTQAAALPALLLPHLMAEPTDGPVVVASSPAVRCTATVAPLAATLRTEVALDAELLEGADVRGLRARIGALAGPTVWCSHGDVIPELLRLLADEGLDLGPDPRCRKASTWVLDVAAGDVLGAVTAALHLPPPTAERTG